MRKIDSNIALLMPLAIGNPHFPIKKEYGVFNCRLMGRDSTTKEIIVDGKDILFGEKIRLFHDSLAWDIANHKEDLKLLFVNAPIEEFSVTVQYENGTLRVTTPFLDETVKIEEGWRKPNRENLQVHFNFDSELFIDPFTITKTITVDDELTVDKGDYLVQNAKETIKRVVDLAYIVYGKGTVEHLVENINQFATENGLITIYNTNIIPRTKRDDEHIYIYSLLDYYALSYALELRKKNKSLKLLTPVTKLKKMTNEVLTDKEKSSLIDNHVLFIENDTISTDSLKIKKQAQIIIKNAFKMSILSLNDIIEPTLFNTIVEKRKKSLLKRLKNNGVIDKETKEESLSYTIENRIVKVKFDIGLIKEPFLVTTEDKQ